MLRWLRRFIEGEPLDQHALLRALAETSRPAGPIIPMREHLASLPPAPPMFEPEWANDTEWHDSRED